MSARIRCAIYTRKSSEEGLEQAFNSLDAQREACLAFIKSQQGLGWAALPAAYEDGGLSGSTLERPALQRLLADIANRRIDLVVVYKVDRLTRSLADFAKIVEVFDASGVSFVSVTQQFNTSTSMGRLTLNMLLSFAQFEREVTGERIRDKIAASKRKGMWTGGPVPLGYEVREKRLVINVKEAATVRTLFRLYLKLGTVQKLVEHARRQGLTTKRRANGGGQAFSRGHLYQLLSNPLYAGDIVHGGQRHPGQHEAIVERRMFDAVRRQLERNRTERQSQTNAKAPSLLSGLVFDEQGDRLSPTHASKQGRRYRYYISRRLMHGGKDQTGWRLPARELEQAVTGTVESFLRDEARIVEGLGLDATPGHLRTMLGRAKALGAEVMDDRVEGRAALLRRLVDRVTIAEGSLRIDLQRRALAQALQLAEVAIAEEGIFSLTASLHLRRRGVEAKLILGGSASVATPDKTLIAAVAQAHRWFARLVSGEVGSIDQIAARERVDASDVGRQVRLAFLAPDIVEAMLAGTQPVELTAWRLKRMGNLPLDWVEQRRLLGFGT